MPAPLAVVVVHWRQPERCVGTVRAFQAQDVPVAVTVVDNGSPAEDVARLRRELPDVEVLPVGGNLGFGPAANVGLRRWLAAGAGDWAVVAPHDAIPEPGCLSLLLEAVRDRPAAGLASAVYGEEGRPVVDRYFGGILLPSEVGAGWEDAGHPHGTLLLARRACLEEVGLFDERYFAYCEEADLGVRARAAGWEVGVVWGAVVRNPSLGTAAPVVDYLQLRNSLLLVRDHFGRYPATIRFLLAVLDTAYRAAVPARRTPYFSLTARRHALVDFGRGRFGPPPAALLR